MIDLSLSPTLWVVVAVTALIALLLPLGLRPLLHSLRVLDIPNARSSHSQPTLRGGGLAPLLAIFVGGLAAAVGMPAAGGDRGLFLSCILAGLAVGALGFVEDIKGLRIALRAGLQLLIGALLAGALIDILGLSGYWIPVTALLFAAYVNFTNFMDGVNGISSLHGFVAGSAYAATGMLLDQPWLILSGSIVAVAFLAFLPWNLAPPGMFLGDVGSYLLGGLLGGTAIALLADGTPLLPSVAPLSIYVVDTVATLSRRAARGEPVFQAHRTHTYQRLVSSGLPHLAVSALVALFTLATSAIGLITIATGLNSVLGALAIGGVCVLYLALPRLRGAEVSESIAADLTPVTPPQSSAERPGWRPTEWAVIGASGFIGTAVYSYLASRGYAVRGLPAPRVELSPKAHDGAAVAALAMKHDAVAVLARELSGVEVVINAAGAATPDNAATPTLYGANALLPGIIVHAAKLAGADRVVHLSSAAVQGDRPVIDDSPDVSPMSPYSRSKALGERAVLAAGSSCSHGGIDVVVLRATSVQGRGRQTTRTLKRVATSPLSSVASPGDQPTVVSSVGGLVRFIEAVGASQQPQNPIRLQPWEGLSAAEVLHLAGGKPPTILPAWLCRQLVRLGRVASSVLPQLGGPVRRLELMWFGQRQVSTIPGSEFSPGSDLLRATLRESD